MAFGGLCLKGFYGGVVVILGRDIELPEGVALSDVSDGFHTFNELYLFRTLYNAALFNIWSATHFFDVHKSRCHSDGLACFGGGWFVVVAQLPCGQISNHYEMEYWSLFRIPEREKAADFDGHTSADVISRLSQFLEQS